MICEITTIHLCNICGLVPVLYDVYIVNNHGEELKAKAPPFIGYAMFQVEIVTDGLSWYTAFIKLWHHVNMHSN